MNPLCKNTSLLLACGVSVLLTPLVAQKAVTSNAILLAMGANAKQVVQYEWKQRITVTRKENTAEPVIDQIRFDADGQMQRTTISAPQQKEMRGLRGRVTAGVKEDVQQMMELAGRYNKPQQMAAAIRKAQISQGVGAIRLEAGDLIESADSMTMLVDPATHLATRVDIKTDCDGGPMTIAQDYAPIPGGPNMMKNMTVTAPKKAIVVKVESYDYARQSAGSRP